jgi:hypothetical protein
MSIADLRSHLFDRLQRRLWPASNTQGHTQPVRSAFNSIEDFQIDRLTTQRSAALSLAQSLQFAQLLYVRSHRGIGGNIAKPSGIFVCQLPNSTRRFGAPVNALPTH